MRPLFLARASGPERPAFGSPARNAKDADQVNCGLNPRVQKYGCSLFQSIKTDWMTRAPQGKGWSASNIWTQSAPKIHDPNYGVDYRVR